ncbi:uncharacterized protein LOC114291780 [Camellia sinensis]|uniref:uncharacterized protein LOC114291780 n=1 Tax=Camellia sinensis TaxID=4442 RepID=UPI001036BAF4|nr:uncharacterized protein LOC114291780 [Camellia sinensis]
MNWTFRDQKGWSRMHCCFRNGFQARRQEGTLDEVYFNLEHYVHRGGRPLDSTLPTAHAFVSTTLNTAWHPSLNIETKIEVYRYEIYAPGGIWVAETHGDRYQYAARDGVCFVAGIAPQYIRSAQLFRLIASTRYTRLEKIDNVIRINGKFNPQSHPSRLLNIRRPIFDCLDANCGRVPLTISIYQPSAISVSEQEKQQQQEVSIDCDFDCDTTHWYAGNVANSESYMNAAFRSSRTNEAYIFMQDECVLLEYAPSSTYEKVLHGPVLFCHGYPSLTGTAFAEHGIDCAFGSHNENEASIFSGNLCAQINYTPGTTNDNIIKGPMTITAMFPSFKGTVFESGVDAAFESTKRYEAYLFKENQYAYINYSSDSHLFVTTQGFPSLKNTIFENGIDAALALHRTDEAYLFKGDSYARINFAPGTTNDYIMVGVKKFFPNLPSLHCILPRKNHGLEVHDHTKPDDDRDHDEL